MNRRRIAPVLIVALVAGAITAYLVLAIAGPTVSGASDLLFVVVFAGFALVGAVILRNLPGHVIGRIAAVLGLMNLYGGVAAELAIRRATEPEPISAYGSLTLWLTNWSWHPGAILLVLMLLLYPTGRLLSHHWKPVLGALLVIGAAVIFLGMFGPPPPDALDSPLYNPLQISGVPGVESPIGGVLYALLGLVAVLSLWSLGLRMFRGDSIERRQARWLALSFGLLLVLGIVDATAPVEVPNWAFAPVWLGIPVSIGVAILRYRLYEIDRIVSRTVSYGLVAAALATIYALPVILLPTALGGNNDLVIAGATLAAAAAFKPLLRHIQRRVDRRFNRARYDAEREIAGFSQQLRNHGSAAAIAGSVYTTLGRTLAPAQVGVWIRDVKPSLLIADVGPDRTLRQAATTAWREQP